jgi:hypothetical protein
LVILYMLSVKRKVSDYMDSRTSWGVVTRTSD